MRFLTKFALALVLPAFVPAEPFEPLVTVTYKGEAASVPYEVGVVTELSLACSPAPALRLRCRQSARS